MFDSSYTDYKITNTPYGKDVVRQLADACQGRGMPLGFYYSPPDMHHTPFRATAKLPNENSTPHPPRPESPSHLHHTRLPSTPLPPPPPPPPPPSHPPLHHP